MNSVKKNLKFPRIHQNDQLNLKQLYQFKPQDGAMSLFHL